MWCICLLSSSASLPLCFIDHGHILQRSQCFPKVCPAWWLDLSQLWDAAGLQLNDSDWLWLVLWVGIVWIKANHNDGELAVKCSQMVRRQNLDLTFCRCLSVHSVLKDSGNSLHCLYFFKPTLSHQILMPDFILSGNFSSDYNHLYTLWS